MICPLGPPLLDDPYRSIPPICTGGGPHPPETAREPPPGIPSCCIGGIYGLGGITGPLPELLVPPGLEGGRDPCRGGIPT